MVNKTCVACNKGAPTYFFLDDSLVCRFCMLENDFDEKIRDMKNTYNEKIKMLQEKINLLEKQENNDQQCVPAIKLIRKENKTKHPVPMVNRYECLEADENIEISIIGDSQIRNLGLEICNRRNKNVKKSKKKFSTICYPGATTDQIHQAIDSLNDKKANTDFVLHVGGNDVRNRDGKFNRSEEVIKKYQKMLAKCKEKSRKTIVTGILPRPSENIEWLSRAIAMNDRIKKTCNNLELQFIDLWDIYINGKEFYTTKGVHINNKGLKKLSEIIYEQFTHKTSQNQGN